MNIFILMDSMDRSSCSQSQQMSCCGCLFIYQTGSSHMALALMLVQSNPRENSHVAACTSPVWRVRKVGCLETCLTVTENVNTKRTLTARKSKFFSKMAWRYHIYMLALTYNYYKIYLHVSLCLLVSDISWVPPATISSQVCAQIWPFHAYRL